MRIVTIHIKFVKAGLLATGRQHHPLFLPPAFSRFRVESGGVGAGSTLRLARKTLSHLSIIIVLTPHREHFSFPLKFTPADKI